MGKYFGTDGFRGEANVVLTVEHAFKVGRYLGWYFGQDHKARIVIGKDTRRSSYMFEYALAAGPCIAIRCFPSKPRRTASATASCVERTLAKHLSL